METEIPNSANDPDARLLERLAAFPLRMRRGLRFRAEGPENDWMCFLEDPAEGRSYALSPWQRWFLELIEARTPVRDAARLVAASCPEVVSISSVVRFIDWLSEQGLLEEISTLDMEQRRTATGTEPRTRSRSARRRRLAMNAVALLLIAAGLWLVKPVLRTPAPVEMAIPAVTIRSEMKKAKVVAVRAASAGILTDVIVDDGDAVKAGELMARIKDPGELEILDQLRADLNRSRQRRDAFSRASNRAGYLREMRRMAEISRELGLHEARATVAELRAPVDGTIETEPPCGNIGGEVAEGEILLRVHAGDDDLIATL